jgi:hypothetical protein
MKFNVTWIKESTVEVDMPDIHAAEEYGVKLINRLGGFPTAKLLSIHEIKPTDRKDDKPPTPFGAPPSGTLGGGQVAVAKPLVDQVAA